MMMTKKRKEVLMFVTLCVMGLISIGIFGSYNVGAGEEFLTSESLTKALSVIACMVVVVSLLTYKYRTISLFGIACILCMLYLKGISREYVEVIRFILCLIGTIIISIENKLLIKSSKKES